jgi:hypothetical protein
VGHLQDKLESTREEVGGKKIELLDETVAEVLRECELCLTNILRRIKAADDEKKRSKMTSLAASKYADAKYAGGAKEDDDGDEDDDMNAMRPYNQRIDLESNEDEGFVDFGDDSAPGDLDDEELTREKV